MNKEVLKSVISTFESNPEVSIFHVTADGQCFGKKNLAIMHANSLHDSAIIMLTKAAAEKFLSGKGNTNQDTGDNIKLSLEERLQAVENAKTTDDLEKLLEGESAKTVKAAISDKIEALQKESLIAQIEAAETIEAVDALITDQEDEEVLAAAHAQKLKIEGK